MIEKRDLLFVDVDVHRVKRIPPAKDQTFFYFSFLNFYLQSTKKIVGFTKD